MKKRIGLVLLIMAVLMFLVSCNDVTKNVQISKTKLNFILSGVMASDKGIPAEIKWDAYNLKITAEGTTIVKTINSTAKSFSMELPLKDGKYNFELTAVDSKVKIKEGTAERAKKLFYGSLTGKEIKQGENKIEIPVEFQKSVLKVTRDNATFREVTSYLIIKNIETKKEEKIELKDVITIKAYDPAFVEVRIDINGKEGTLKTMEPKQIKLLPDETQEIALGLKDFGVSIALPYIPEIKALKSVYENAAVKISWNYDDTTASYKVYRKLSKDVTIKLIGETTNKEFVDAAPEKDNIEYYVCAVAKDRNSGLTKTAIDLSKETFVSVINNLKAQFSNGTVLLKWDDSKEAESYIIEMKKDSDTEFKKVAESKINEYKLVTEEKGNYTVSVKAKNSTSTSLGKTIQVATPYSVNYNPLTIKEKYMLVSNEGYDPNKKVSSGTLPTVMKKYEEPEGLALDAYKMNPELPLPEGISKDNIYRAAKNIEAEKINIGDKQKFWVLNWNDNSKYELEGTLQYVGTKCHVWVEDPAIVKPEDAEKIGKEFDQKIFGFVTDNFYDVSDVDNNGIVNIFCFDIVDGWNGTTKTGCIGGYFGGIDLFDLPESNKMEIFYIDTYPSMHRDKTKPVDIKGCISTLVHEFQHMVNFNRNYLVEGWPMDSWINEGLSMGSEQMYYGILNHRIDYFNKSAAIRDGHSLLYWNNSDPNVLSNYALSYLFLQYFKEQCGQGDKIFKELLYLNDNDYKGIEKLVHKYVNPTMTFGEFITSFRLALLLKEKEGLYGFKGNPGFDGIQVQLSTQKNTMLRGGGAFFKEVTTPVTRPADAGSTVKFVGIGK